MRGDPVKLTGRQVAFIKNNWNKMSNADMARKFNVNFSTFSGKLHKLGLFRMHFEYWTDEQTEFLKNNYQTIGDKELAILFNGLWEKEKRWSFKHIEKKRKYLGLHRSKKEIITIKIRNTKRGCFQGMGTWKTRHASPVGTIKIWTWNNRWHAKVIKTEKGFVMYSRWLYKQHFGSIPDGFVVGYRDMNNMNVTINNLELITRAEHQRRHITKYPEELRNLEKTLKQLNNTIKQSQ